MQWNIFGRRASFLNAIVNVCNQSSFHFCLQSRALGIAAFKSVTRSQTRVHVWSNIFFWCFKFIERRTEQRKSIKKRIEWKWLFILFLFDEKFKYYFRNILEKYPFIITVFNFINNTQNLDSFKLHTILSRTILHP